MHKAGECHRNSVNFLCGCYWNIRRHSWRELAKSCEDGRGEAEFCF